MKKNKNYPNTSVKQKLFFFCFCWDDNTLTAAHNDKCDEQNAHVEKIQRNNNEIS